MPIVKYIPVHSTPKYAIEYALDKNKNADLKYAYGNLCSTDPMDAYCEFKNTFERYAHERFYKKLCAIEGEKETVRLHHYVQSFVPGETTPEEAHKIGMEWAKKVFGANRRFIVSTHIDKGHIHNHVIVNPYDSDGQRWYANKTTLNNARKISDKLASEHGLSVIDHPKYKNRMSYYEWIEKQQGYSWKAELKNKIDELIVQDDVKSLDDLINQLDKSGYTVKKYKTSILIQEPKYKRIIRNYNLGDGYNFKDLVNRIAHKENEVSIVALKKLNGYALEAGMYLRSLQIRIYHTHNPQKIGYREISKNIELLDFIKRNDVKSADHMRDIIDAADEQYQQQQQRIQDTKKRIREMSKIIRDAPIYLRLADKMIDTTEEKAQWAKVKYLNKSDVTISDESDILFLQDKLSALNEDLKNQQKELASLKEKRAYAGKIYMTYQSNCARNDYQIMLEKVREELADKEKLNEYEYEYTEEKRREDWNI